MAPNASTGSSSAAVLVLIIGPIASGKSTVARALADSLRASGDRVALVELDQIAEMALPTLPDWGVAQSIFGSVVGQWLRSALDVVIAEGSGNQSELEVVLREVPEGVDVLTVVLTSSFELAHARALRDPSRGISRDRDFLAGEYRRWEHDLPLLKGDVILDTSEFAVELAVAAIEAGIRKPRV